MATPLLLDTDVLVDYLRDRADAVAYVEAQKGPLMVSAITVAELYAGVKDDRERPALDGFFGAFEVVPVDQEIARKGGLYRRDYGPSSGVGLADALIAATAAIKRARLVTLNERHFSMIPVIVPYRKAR